MDFALALREAEDRDDAAGGRVLRNLQFDYFQTRLAGYTPEKLQGYLEGLAVWRFEAGVAVFKTADQPCAAFAALEFPEGIRVLVLGFCYRHRVSAADWWEAVIRPRVKEYLDA